MFIIPKNVIKEIEQKSKAFLRSGVQIELLGSRNVKVLCAILTQKEVMGLRRIVDWNIVTLKACMGLVFRICLLWVAWSNFLYLGRCFRTIPNPNACRQFSDV